MTVCLIVLGLRGRGGRLALLRLVLRDPTPHRLLVYFERGGGTLYAQAAPLPALDGERFLQLIFGGQAARLSG